MLDKDQKILHFQVPYSMAGSRLDQVLAKLLPEYSRSFLSTMIKEELVSVDGKLAQPKLRLIGGEKIDITPKMTNEESSFCPEDIDFDVVFEDEDIIVVNKDKNMVVHPAGGNWSGTLLNGLLFRYPELKTVPRAGIVHRLDKDTTGLMVVSRNIKAQTHLVRQLQERTVSRTYRAIADGFVPYDGTIKTLMGRHPTNRKKMAVLKENGKEAITHIKILEHFPTHTYIECRLETGRTHQIRVHMKEAGHPLVGDQLYGNKRVLAKGEIRDKIMNFGRQALHAYKLKFIHPSKNEEMEFTQPLPQDMQDLLDLLRFHSAKDVSETFLENRFGRNEDGTINLPESVYLDYAPQDGSDDDWDDWDDWDDGDTEVIYTNE